MHVSKVSGVILRGKLLVPYNMFNEVFFTEYLRADLFKIVHLRARRPQHLPSPTELGRPERSRSAKSPWPLAELES